LARSWAGRKCLHAGLGRFRGYKARRQMCALMDGLAGPLRNPSASQVHRHPEVPARSVGLEGRRPLRLGRVLRGSLPLAGAALTTLRIAAFATRRQSGTANPSTCLRERTANVGALFHVLQPQLGRHGYLRAISVAIAQWVVTLNPRGAISTGTDTWSVGARAGDFIFVAGMQGVDPATNKLVEGDEARIRQAFLNLKLIAESAGATLQDCVRLTVYVSDLHRFAPLVSKVQAELWGKPPYPPRTMFEVQRLFDDDIVEIDSIFYAPTKK